MQLIGMLDSPYVRRVVEKAVVNQLEVDAELPRREPDLVAVAGDLHLVELLHRLRPWKARSVYPVAKLCRGVPNRQHRRTRMTTTTARPSGRSWWS